MSILVVNEYCTVEGETSFITADEYADKLNPTAGIAMIFSHFILVNMQFLDILFCSLFRWQKYTEY